MPESADHVFLDQTPPNQVEGPAKETPPTIYEVQRVALAVGATARVRTRERAGFWQVAALADTAALGDHPLLLVNQGETSLPSYALQLGDGGAVTFPAASSALTLVNAGDVALFAVVIMLSGSLVDYNPGRSLV